MSMSAMYYNVSDEGARGRGWRAYGPVSAPCEVMPARRACVSDALCFRVWRLSGVVCLSARVSCPGLRFYSNPAGQGFQGRRLKTAFGSGISRTREPLRRAGQGNIPLARTSWRGARAPGPTASATKCRARACFTDRRCRPPPRRHVRGPHAHSPPSADSTSTCLVLRMCAPRSC